MKEFFKYLQLMKEHPNKSFCLATVIGVEGSAYRHEGAKMLFCDNNNHYGMISGGCLEEDLQYYAMETIAENKPKVLTYDLRAEDDLGWGKGAGCNGKVTILLDPVSWKRDKERQEAVLPTILYSLEQGKKIICVREVKEGKHSTWITFNERGKLNGDIPEELDSVIRKIIGGHFEDNFLVHYSTERNSTFIVEELLPKDKLYIFGSTADVKPIINRAAEFYFSPIVITNSLSFETAELPVTAKVVKEHPLTFIEHNNISEDSYVLIMTHNFQTDQQLLKHFIQYPTRYIGVLGPKARTERLLTPQSIPNWLHTPVGIDIFAEGADEISISILSELIKVRNEKAAIRRRKKRLKNDNSPNHWQVY